MESNLALIPLMVLVPLFAAAALLLPLTIFKDRRTLWTFALGSSLVTFIISLLVALEFDWTSPAGYQLAGALPWVSDFGISFGYGIDAISLWLILLTTFLMPLILLASSPTPLLRSAATKGLVSETPATKDFFFWLLMVEGGSLATFAATDALFFFLGFEFTLIPLYFLIGVYGGKKRLPAARMFFIYTFTGSMLMFAGLLYIAWFGWTLTGHWSFDFAALYTAAQQMSFSQQMWVLLALLAGFAVKIPIFPLHTWLPLTYVEAPIAGTVVLAAVLAKLGTYGLLRLAMPMCPEAFVALAPVIAILAIIGILYAALISWVQKDLKRLVAYSSISHLGFIVLGLVALDVQDFGPVGATIYMVNHGLATGALFLCIGMIRNRLNTSDMGDISGLFRHMPVWAFFMVFFMLCAVGLPGLNGFVGEFLTLIGAFNSTHLLGMAYGAVAGLGIILGAIYLFYMVGRVVFGPLKLPRAFREVGVSDLTPNEIWALAPIAVACLFLGLYPFPVLKSLEAPVNAMTIFARREVHNPTNRVTLEKQKSNKAIKQKIILMADAS